MVRSWLNGPAAPAGAAATGSFLIHPSTGPWSSQSVRWYGSSASGATGKLSCGGGEGQCHSSVFPPHGFGGALGPCRNAWTQLISTNTSPLPIV